MPFSGFRTYIGAGLLLIAGILAAFGLLPGDVADKAQNILLPAVLLALRAAIGKNGK